MSTERIIGSGAVALLAAVAVSCGGNATGAGKQANDVPQYKGFTTVKGYVTTIEDEGIMNPAPIGEWEPYGQPTEDQPYVHVSPRIRFQEIIGFGGAVTDAAAETFAKLPAPQQERLLAAYYGPNGIGYNTARVNIAGCDFSSGSYDYIAEGDTELTSFDIGHDLQYRVPMLERITELTRDKLYIMGSPWSPPAWMKSNGDVLHGGTLLEEYADAWARHFVKFAEAYDRLGLPLWAVSAQNETMAVQTWESCVYTAEAERDFIKNHLGPTLEKSPYRDLKLIAWDHNRDLLFHRADVIMADPEAARHVWGFGYHWYEPWIGGDMQFGNLKLTHEAFPDKHLVFTEGCVEGFDFDRIGSWELGERYGYSILNDLNSGMSAWIDWNILLDETGGPNHVGNLCFAPVHADTRTGELLFTNSFAYIGHFSKFIQRGARRVAVSSSRYDLQATGALNPDGSLVVVMLNRSEKKIDFRLGLDGQGLGMSSAPRSITTVVFE